MSTPVDRPAAIEELVAAVEIPKGSRNKYEFDPDWAGSSSTAC